MAVEPCVNIEVLVMGTLQNNVYIIEGPDATLVVDPTSHAERIVEALGTRKLDAIVLTHAHHDHVGAARALRALTGAPTIASTADAPYIDGRDQLAVGPMRFDPCEIDREVEDGEVVEIGSMKWRVMVTPGHTPGSMCLFLDPACGTKPDGLPVLLAGDTMFAGTHGRTDFPKGNASDMRASLARLLELPADTLVLPGHNDFTTIERERRTYA